MFQRKGFTMYHMTQSHHMISQKIASADPGDALNLRKLAGAENRMETKREKLIYNKTFEIQTSYYLTACQCTNKNRPQFTNNEPNDAQPLKTVWQTSQV